MKSTQPTPLARLALSLIRGYQKTLSPDTGVPAALFPWGFCRFHPTCSSYTHQAIERYGVARGFMKGIARVLRCTPWNPGGFDPLT